MSMRINIHQTNAILGIDIQQAQLIIKRSRELRMNIEQENARMQIEWNRPQVKPSGTGNAVASAVPRVPGSAPRIIRPDFTKHSKLDSSEGGAVPKAGAAQSAINISRSIVESQKQRNAERKIEPGHYTFKYEGGRIKIRFEEIPQETEFINYSVDIYLLQEPSIEITVDEYIDRLIAEQKDPSGQIFNEAL